MHQIPQWIKSRPLTFRSLRNLLPLLVVFFLLRFILPDAWIPPGFTYLLLTLALFLSVPLDKAARNNNPSFLRKQESSDVQVSSGTFSTELFLKLKCFKMWLILTVGLFLCASVLLVLMPSDETTQGYGLLVLQWLLFLLWSVWFFRQKNWSRDGHTFWTIAATIELLLLPSLRLTRAILGFGLLAVLSLWVAGESGKLDSCFREE
jgi:hypothetical protein